MNISLPSIRSKILLTELNRFSKSSIYIKYSKAILHIILIYCILSSFLFKDFIKSSFVFKNYKIKSEQKSLNSFFKIVSNRSGISMNALSWPEYNYYAILRATVHLLCLVYFSMHSFHDKKCPLIIFFFERM